VLRVYQELTAVQAYQLLENDPGAALVDVRTEAEWMYVGGPDLTGLRRRPFLVPWVAQAGNTPDPDFLRRLSEVLDDRNTPVVFLCRSGLRSAGAAEAAVRAGFTQVFNVMDGFEGPVDEHGHRGMRSGWKAAGLPWRQS
jgi:rhodanese-related sulfurtransferase